MRYKLASGIEIRTENAAKPESQPSKFLLDLIANLPHVASTFDYGCGKLRYQRAIADTTDVLAIVDSESSTIAATSPAQKRKPLLEVVGQHRFCNIGWRE